MDLRVVSATDAPIDGEGASFSRALRHRLAALEIRLRPLASHREDIGLLARHYLALAFETAGRPAPWERCSRDPCHCVRCAELFDALLACHGPGNIRELANVCRELAVACPDDLSVPAALARRLVAPPPAGEVVEEPRDAVSEADFVEAWAANDYEVARVARVLNMSRGAVYRRVREMPGCRLAGDIPRDELQAALEEAGGDVAAAARTLCVSHAGLRARLRVAGERVAEDACGPWPASVSTGSSGRSARAARGPCSSPSTPGSGATSP
jgi:two-component system nitrogen regulation response regulator GlnG